MNIDKEAVFFGTKNEQEKQEGKGKGKVKKFLCCRCYGGIMSCEGFEKHRK